MTELKSRLYTAKARSTGGRDGHTASLLGDFKAGLATPKEMGGPGGEGTNPEELFACGYSACFLNAVKFIAMRQKIPFDANNSTCEAHVTIGEGQVGFGLEVALTVTLPNLEQAEAEKLVEVAHQTCPYSNAVRNNVRVDLTVIGKA